MHRSRDIRVLSVEDKEEWFLDALTLKLGLEIAENITRYGASS